MCVILSHYRRGDIRREIMARHTACTKKGNGGGDGMFKSIVEVDYHSIRISVEVIRAKGSLFASGPLSNVDNHSP